MKKYSISFLIICLIQLTKCSSSNSIYDSNEKLSNDYVISKHSSLKLQIPIGWFKAEEEQENNFDFWLVKNDYTATIKLFIINLSDELKNDSLKTDVKSIAEIEMDLIRNKFKNNFKGFNNIEKFSLNDKICFAFEFLDEHSNPTRIIIFKYQNQFYEVSASTKNISTQQEIFSIQNTIIKSIHL
ncbi:MAG: hypothetical protein N2321_09765 [Melioribacteraceae bacterium]|nr:hypothetical protein [Melioribacteraceae bacterium]